jgi:hypothetical protein
MPCQAFPGKRRAVLTALVSQPAFEGKEGPGEAFLLDSGCEEREYERCVTVA